MVCGQFWYWWSWSRPVLPLPWAQDSQTQLLYRSYAYTYAAHQERKIDLSESRELRSEVVWDEWPPINSPTTFKAYPIVLSPMWTACSIQAVSHHYTYVHVHHYPSLPTSVLKVQNTHSVRQDYQSHILCCVVGWIHSLLVFSWLYYMYTQACPNRLSDAENTFFCLILLEYSFLQSWVALLVVLIRLLMRFVC